MFTRTVPRVYPLEVVSPLPDFRSPPNGSMEASVAGPPGRSGPSNIPKLIPKDGDHRARRVPEHHRGHRDPLDRDWSGLVEKKSERSDHADHTRNVFKLIFSKPFTTMKIIVRLRLHF